MNSHFGWKFSLQAVTGVRRIGKDLLKLCKKPDQSVPQRCLWGWLNSVFNRVDNDRVKLVGADRACAEWLLRCGASVRWKDRNHWEKDYNLLPPGSFEKYKIEEIDASDSAVMGIGFPHLDGLKHVRKIILHNCVYLDNSALEFLPLVQDTLHHLQLSSCGDINDQGLVPITELKKLQTLLLFDLPEIQDKDRSIRFLQNALPSCDIKYLEPRKKEVSEET